MPDAVELKILPSLRSCPGIPACDLIETICEDHRDVLKALREAVGFERARCAKVAEEYRTQTWTPENPVDGVEITKRIREGR
ncbi:MAG TPA: hypothetical protein VEA41_23190 [Salinarimonas sp.]|nr:hypothetical protein [Salinarimonas sp.]